MIYSVKMARATELTVSPRQRQQICHREWHLKCRLAGVHSKKVMLFSCLGIFLHWFSPMTPRTKVNYTFEKPMLYYASMVCEFVHMVIVFSISVAGWRWSIGHLKHVFLLRLEPPSKHATIWKRFGLDPSQSWIWVPFKPTRIWWKSAWGRKRSSMLIGCCLPTRHDDLPLWGTCELRDATSIQKS